MNTIVTLQHENIWLKKQIELLKGIITDKSVNGIDTIVTGPGIATSDFTSKQTIEPYRIFVEKMQEGAITINQNRIITYCNTYFGNMLKKPINTVMGKKIDVFIRPESVDHFFSLFIKSKTENSRGEIYFISSEGFQVPAYLSMSPLKIESEFLICIIVHDLSDKKQYEKILKSEELYRSIINQANAAIIVCDKEGNIIKTSNSSKELCYKDALNRNRFNELFTLTFFDNDKPFSIDSVLSGKIFSREEMILSDPTNGKPINILFSANSLHNDKQELIGCVATIIDISEQKQNQKLLLQSVEEKKILLKEVHHRVKNNLTIINSLIGMQTVQCENTEYRLFLQQLEQRIHSIALIYEQLHSNQNFDSINFSLYIQELIDNFVSAFSLHNIYIHVDQGDRELSLSIDKAITLGLILTELITNAIKHAFPENRKGNIYLSIEKKHNELIFTIADDGIGMDPHSFSCKEYIGTSLIKHLTHQLQGTLDLETHNGTTVVLRIPS